MSGASRQEKASPGSVSNVPQACRGGGVMGEQCGTLCPVPAFPGYRFSIESEVDLRKPLRYLGICNVFSLGQADFTSFSSEGRPFLSYPGSGGGEWVGGW